MKAGAVRKLSGAELRAMRDQRAAADPAAEAWAHESSFLRCLATAQEDFDWIVAHEAWTLLGHDTFADWWDARAPRMRELGFQPTKQIALAVLTRIRSDEEKLPRAQRRTSKQLAVSVGLSESSVRRIATRSLPPAADADADLEETSGAVPPASTEDASPVLGGPDDSEKAAESSGTTDPSAVAWPTGDEGAGRAPLGQEEVGPTGAALEELIEEEAASVGQDPGCENCGQPIGDEHEVASGNARCEACDPDGDHVRRLLPDETFGLRRKCHPGLAAVVDGKDEEPNEEAGERLGCGRCDFSIPVSEVDPDASLDDLYNHLVGEHDLVPVAVLEELADLRTISPAADEMPHIPTAEASPTPVPQQPGQDSPIGRDHLVEEPSPEGPAVATSGRSETDHHPQGVPGGEAPGASQERVPVEPDELGDGGGAPPRTEPSPSDPDDEAEDEHRPIDLVLMTFDALVNLLDHIDVDAVGPVLFPAELEQLHQQVETLQLFVNKVSKARFDAMTRTP